MMKSWIKRARVTNSCVDCWRGHSHSLTCDSAVYEVWLAHSIVRFANCPLIAAQDSLR